MTTEEDKWLRAAWLYYQNQLTQAEIAQRMHVSRATVGRYLESARDAGFVQIRITRPLSERHQLEETFLQTFGLSEVAIVDPEPTSDELYESVARAGADLLQSLLYPGCHLGLAWGRTASLMAKYLPSQTSIKDITVHEIVGTHLRLRPDFHFASQIAQRLDAPLERLPVPVLMENPAAREAILQEQSIRDALAHAAGVNLAFVGLGSVDHDSSLIKAGYMNIAQISELARRDAAGEILMHFYDQGGSYVDCPELEARAIGLTWPQIRAVDLIVGLATGANKVRPILGALRGKIIQGLVTDAETAGAVLAMHRSLNAIAA